jgi:hypothetical protein
MGGALIAGLPSRDGLPSQAPANHELSDPDDAKPAAHAPLGTDPAQIGKAPAQPGFGGNNLQQAITPLTWESDLNASSHHPEPIRFAWVQPAVLRSPALWDIGHRCVPPTMEISYGQGPFFRKILQAKGDCQRNGTASKPPCAPP